MATGSLRTAIERLRGMVGRQDPRELADGDLLKLYVRRQDEAAFAALVRRHGPMVMGLCRRILRHAQDAEDAFQATFLVLVRKASTLRSPGLVANWLYGVAYRTALEARKAAARRRSKEAQVVPQAQRAEDAWADLRPVLDQELERLPEKYRAAIVLCDLEGKTRKEAARHLGWPEGTVASRLAAARTRLAKALSRHGVGLPAGGIAALLAQKASAALPAALVSTTLKAAAAWTAGPAAAAGRISAHVSALTEGVLKIMLLTRIKTGLGIFLALSLLALGSVFSYRALAGEKTGAARQDRLADTLILLDKQLWEAASKYDVDTLAKIFADDWVGFNAASSPQRGNKAYALEHYKHSRYTEVKFLTERQVFRVDEHSAIMSYEVKWRGEDRGKEHHQSWGHNRIIHCWVQRDGGWFVKYTENVNLPLAAPAGPNPYTVPKGITFPAPPTRFHFAPPPRSRVAVRASSSWENNTTPDRAFDGNRDTYWNSGGYAPAWIEADLGAPTPLGSILLLPVQDIPGPTTHEVWVSSEPIGDNRAKATLVHTFRGNTTDKQPLALDFPRNLSARYVQVRTTQSPTWIAWWEVEIRVRKNGKVQGAPLRAQEGPKQPRQNQGKARTPPKEKADGFAWGPAVPESSPRYAGLQVGVGVRPAGKRTYKIGEGVQLVLKARNVGKAPVKISYYEGLPWSPLAVADAQGRPVKLWVGVGRQVGFVNPRDLPPWHERSLKPGEEVELGSQKLDFVSPRTEPILYPNGSLRHYSNPAVQVVPGKYKVSYAGVCLNQQSLKALSNTTLSGSDFRLDASVPPFKALSNTTLLEAPLRLSTGQLEVEVVGGAK